MGRAAATAALAVAISMLASPGDARADVLVRIDKSSQRMSVIVNGEHRHTWAVSTGIYGTPSGTFRPQSLARHHRSTLYNNAPMPYSIFYDGNFAIHGTTHVSRLGGPASRGCVRLHPANAAVLFALVRAEGLGNTRISIQWHARDPALTSEMRRGNRLNIRM
jgi:lipoprotein-anchoring transpeptidase ErfK/SrfK